MVLREQILVARARQLSLQMQERVFQLYLESLKLLIMSRELCHSFTYSKGIWVSSMGKVCCQVWERWVGRTKYIISIS